ncbi:MAG: DUF4390 domain-containing protein [Candidatus Neomarinimicrobiota bacterium]
MEENVFALLSKKIVAAVIAIGSMFYSTISGVIPQFEEVNLEAKGDRLVLSTRLVNCFSEDLDRIFSSGQEIQIHFLVEVIGVNTDEAIHEMTFYHSVEYSLVEQIYEVFCSHHGERRDGLSLEEAKVMLAEVDEIAVAGSRDLSSGEEYSVLVTALMEEIDLPGMDERLNLMFYWSSQKPVATSDPFEGDIFRQ